jgi:hypothetical protein
LISGVEPEHVFEAAPAYVIWQIGLLGQIAKRADQPLRAIWLHGGWHMMVRL